jgi:hypothetical protein
MDQDESRASHWDRVHRTRLPTEVSWYQQSAGTSLELIARAGIGQGVPVLDVGAGGSTLVDGLLDRGFTDVSLLDIAAPAFDATRARLGSRASSVQFFVADVTSWLPPRTYGLWHDRAVFHFLTEESHRAAYRDALRRGLADGGHAIIGTFAEDGPERCSGLPVRRYSAEALVSEFDGDLRPVEDLRSVHLTPSGGRQPFVFVLFERSSSTAR